VSLYIVQMRTGGSTVYDIDVQYIGGGVHTVWSRCLSVGENSGSLRYRGVQAGIPGGSMSCTFRREMIFTR
jgi:hypothetical protein